MKRILPAKAKWVLATAAVVATARAEGTRELRPTPASTCYLQVWDTETQPTRRFMTYESTDFPDYRLNIRIARVGERIYMGFKMLAGYTGAMFVRLKDPQGNIVFGPMQLPQTGVPLSPVGPGFIATYDQAVAGPNPQGVCPPPHNVNPGGYHPLFFLPQTTGDYFIEFNPDQPVTLVRAKRLFEFFDVTVTDAHNVPIRGRLWSKAWDGNMNSFAARLDATFYVYSKDSVVTRFHFNGMQPFGFILSCNSRGCANTGNHVEDRKSRPGNVTFPEFPLFLNNPDPEVFPSGTIGDLDTIYTVACSRDRTHVVLYATNAGTVEILVNLNGRPDYQPGTRDVLIAQEVHRGWNTVVWNNVDGLGQPAPVGTAFDVVATYVWGLTHLPLYDVENHENGFAVELVRPTTSGTPPQAVPPPLIYWDDSNLPGGTVNLFGCDFVGSPSGGCHSWGPPVAGCASNVCATHWGDVRTINTWWFTHRRVRSTVHVIDPVRFVEARAGENQAVCEGATTAPVVGTVRNVGGGEWISISGGTFSDVNTVNAGPGEKHVYATYHFSAADAALGYADLILRTQNAADGCENVQDTVRVFMRPLINGEVSGTSAYACGGTGQVFSHHCPTGYTCYWQTTETGTSTAAPATEPLTLNPPPGSSVTAYLRGRLDVPPHCWTAVATFTMIHAPVPPTPAVSIGPVNCATGNATVTRTFCPPDATCFWQSGPHTFETVHSGTTFTTQQPTITTAYIRARHNVTGCWSPVVEATPVNTVAQAIPLFTVTCNQVVLTRQCPPNADCYWQTTATGTATTGTTLVTPRIQGLNQSGFSIDRTAPTLTFTATRNAQGTFTVFLRARNRGNGCWSQALALTFTVYDVSNNVNNAGTTTALARGYWKGMKSDDWHDPCNWVDMVVPAAQTGPQSHPELHVFVSGPTVFNGVPRPLHMPVVYRDDTPYGPATTLNLQIEPGASVTMNYVAPATLMVKNSLWVRPQGTFYAGHGRITILENCTLDATTATAFARWFGHESQTRIAGHWERRGFAAYSAGISCVEFFGNQTKNIVGAHTGANKFFDLIINKNDVHTLVVQTPGSSVEVGGQLRLRSGCLQNNVPAMTAQDECVVLNDGENAIAEFGENAYVRGKLRRVIRGGAEYSYHFPVGHQTTNINYQLATVRFTATHAGVASLVVFFNGRPSNEIMAVPNVPDQGVWMQTSVGGGYWTLTPSPVMTAGAYTLTLHKRGRSQSGTVYGVIKRAHAGEAWAMPGVHAGHQDGATLVCARSGYTSFSDADIATGDIPLSAPILQFQARIVHRNQALLTWTTAREIDNYGFEIQHAHEGEFETVGFVEGRGNADTPGDYRFVHADLPAGRHLYRLKQIDFDGKTTYSTTAVVTVTPDANSTTLYPNPSHGPLTLKIRPEEKVRIIIVNADGKTVYDRTLETQTAEIALELHFLPVGAYYVHVHTRRENRSFKWIKI
jgi:hypothetical protein